MVTQLDDAVARGARGLKILKDLGLGVKDKTGKLIGVDDPLLDPIFEECGRLGIPVSLHVSDPEAFFHPIDNTNERYEELIEHPDWSFYGPQFPSKLSILEARDRIIARHRHTTFVALHVAEVGIVYFRPVDLRENDEAPGIGLDHRVQHSLQLLAPHAGENHNRFNLGVVHYLDYPPWKHRIIDTLRVVDVIVARRSRNIWPARLCGQRHAASKSG